jgi:hypothetical protein
MTRALVIAPPILKYAAGPLLGPAQLAGAGRAAGHEVEVLDLNIHLLRDRLPDELSGPPSTFMGDHDKPRVELRQIQRAVVEEILKLGGEVPASVLGEDPILSLTLSHLEVTLLGRAMAAGSQGAFARAHLEGLNRPDVVGVSVLYSGQVLWGLAISAVVRELWPGVPIVWGGPHVTALKPWVERDHAYGALVDGFAFGYAERTWVELLDAIADDRAWPAAVGRAGSGSIPNATPDDGVVPRFQSLDLYGIPRLTLPAQTWRGCPYGRCTYCTYPAVEGSSRELPLEVLEEVIREAAARGAVVSIKDSLLTPKRLREIAELIDGRVPWSGCTKLHKKLDREFLAMLAELGCKTLEIGVETLSDTAQQLVSKKQSLALLEQVLDAATEAGIALVVNYITGFPGEDLQAELLLLEHVRNLLDRPDLDARIEHNTFQLERLAPMGRQPGRYGIRILGSWPWASVLAWEPMEVCSRVSERLAILQGAA